MSIDGCLNKQDFTEDVLKQHISSNAACYSFNCSSSRGGVFLGMFLCQALMMCSVLPVANIQ